MNKTALIRKASDFCRSPRGIRILAAAGILGILLMLIPELLPKGEKEGSSREAADMTDRLEQRLERIVSGIEGTGRCRVMVTLENGVKYVYADGASSGLVRQEQGLLVTELQPSVRGVAVVCEGGNDEAVRRRVTEAVTAVLHITASRVCVVAGSGE